MSKKSLWEKCLDCLLLEISRQEFNTWLRPLKANIDNNSLALLAPNKYVLDNIHIKFLPRIKEIIADILGHSEIKIKLDLIEDEGFLSRPGQKEFLPCLSSKFNFDNFVVGGSNQIAYAAALQVSEHSGEAYNPLFIYGGTGLGKTHLMQAIGNMMLLKNPHAKVLYLHSERFVNDMVKALQKNTINDFKKFYRSLDGLLIDDIQFFAGKDRSQEEFFHTFNALLDGKQQIVLTCDRYPKEIDGIEERLKSRIGWGLTVAIEPPDLETRTAILMNKAEQYGIKLPNEIAFFIAKNITANVRELEGALKRVAANARFTGRTIDLDSTKEALRDLLALQAKLVTIENIQKIVAQYYKIRVADLLSKSRTRSVTRPRQMAMVLAKELTNHSLMEIGDAFGGRDHTTVLHACEKVKELLGLEAMFAEDYRNLIRILST